MKIPKDYKVQDGCWNCMHSNVVYGSYRCNVDKTDCPGPGCADKRHKWLEEHYVQGAGKCGQYVIDEWLKRS